MLGTVTAAIQLLFSNAEKWIAWVLLRLVYVPYILGLQGSAKKEVFVGFVRRLYFSQKKPAQVEQG